MAVQFYNELNNLSTADLYTKSTKKARNIRKWKE